MNDVIIPPPTPTPPPLLVQNLVQRGKNAANTSVFGHGRERHGDLWQRILFRLLVKYVAERGENTVNTSVLGMQYE